MDTDTKRLSNAPLIGAHVSIAGGISKAPDRGAEHGCTAIQVFTKSPNQWRAAPLTDEECEAFQSRWKAVGLRSVVAHDAYLIGVYYLDQLGEDAVRKSLEEFRRAAEIAPDYAPAHAGMAEAHLALGGGVVAAESPRESLARSRAYAERALELDGDLADAHLILARVDLQTDWNWAAAERALERHLELDPNSAGGHGFYSWVLLITGRIDQAVEELKRTIELEPLSHTYT